MDQLLHEGGFRCRGRTRNRLAGGCCTGIFVYLTCYLMGFHCLRACAINLRHFSCVFNKRVETQPSSQLSLF